MKTICSFAVIALCFATPSFAVTNSQQVSNPSFNCARARTVAERAICRIPTLGAKDRAIASLYQRVVRATAIGRRYELADDQALFNRSRENCYTAEQEQDDCLDAIMTARVSVLNGWLRRGFR